MKTKFYIKTKKTLRGAFFIEKRPLHQHAKWRQNRLNNYKETVLCTKNKKINSAVDFLLVKPHTRDMYA